MCVVCRSRQLNFIHHSASACPRGEHPQDMVANHVRVLIVLLFRVLMMYLLLFATGLVWFLFHMSTPSFGVTTAILAVGILYYATITSITVIVTSSTFDIPLSRTLSKVLQRVHAYFCPYGALIS